MRRVILQFASLWLRDMKHFFRQRSRVIGAVGQPIVFWVFLSAGFRNVVTLPGGGGATYAEFLFPGIIVLIALFSAVFSTISLIEDRKSGFLQGVLVAPVPRTVLVLSKLIAGSTLALVQMLLFLCLIPFTSISLTLSGFVLSVFALMLIGMTMTNIGFLLAWNMKSTQGFHAVMNLGLLPLWLLSGAFFPVETAAGWLQWLMRLNPVHYLAVVFQEAFAFGTLPISSDALPALFVSLLLFAGLSLTSVRLAAVRRVP